MTSLQISYFLKVADCMSFSQAAEELYVSQPSVSRQIQLLEKELGHALFDRSRKNAISLTAAGMVFRDAFRRSTQGLEQAKAAAREVSAHDALPLRVGIGQGWDFSDTLIRFQEQVHMRYPQARLSFENSPFHQLHALVENGQLDVALCTKTSVQNFDQLEVMQVGELETRAYVRAGLFRPAEEPLRVSDYDGATLLMLPEEEVPMSLQIIQLQFLAHQVQTTCRRMPNRDSIYQSLLLGEGFAVFDEYMWFGNDPRLTYCALEEQIPVCIVWNKRNQNPLIRLFGEVLTDSLRRPTGNHRQEG